MGSKDVLSQLAQRASDVVTVAEAVVIPGSMAGLAIIFPGVIGGSILATLEVLPGNDMGFIGLMAIASVGVGGFVGVRSGLQTFVELKKKERLEKASLEEVKQREQEIIWRGLRWFNRSSHRDDLSARSLTDQFIMAYGGGGITAEALDKVAELALQYEGPDVKHVLDIRFQQLASLYRIPKRNRDGRWLGWEGRYTRDPLSDPSVRPR